MSSPFLSKSKYLHGLQCEKLLWCDYNAKELIPPVDAHTQAIFDQGHQVGELAKTLFGGGKNIAPDTHEFKQVLQESREAILLRKPLFEAGFLSNSGYARADILEPVGRDAWDIIEVKSSTEVKPVHLHDLAFQKYVYEGAGLRIRACHLMYVNNNYVRRGEINAAELFAREDLTDQVSPLMSTVGPRISTMLGTISTRKQPDVPIGLQCNDPYDCPLIGYCWGFLPDQSVFTLYRYRRSKAFELLHDGVVRLDQLPGSVSLSDGQRIQVNAARTKKAHIDRKGLDSFLQGLVYPLYFLDFETFATAIPQYDLVHPYENIPFQFSLHIVSAPGAEPVHHAFLAGGKTDPRPEVLSRLKSLLGKKGSIVAFNSSFEKTVLQRAIEAYPQYAGWTRTLDGRIVDLLAPFRAFAYYHPDQQGSMSLKSVLPVLTTDGYKNLEIADGTTASLEYCRVTFGDADAGDRERVRMNLEQYCRQDTIGMVKIVDRLRELAGSS